MNKKKLTSLSLSLAIAAGMFSGAAVQAAQYYPDVDENHWAYEWVGYMNEQGYISGYPDGNYYPDQNITRAEYVTILTKMFESAGNSGETFSDVNEGDWFYNAIQAAVADGYLHGYGDGTMKPNNYITREEAAVIVAGAYDLQLNSDVSQFSDADQISDWAVPYVGALAGDEVLLGDNDSSYRPKDYMSRAEVASMLARAKQRDDNEELTKNVRVTLPTAMTDADGVYTIADITTENATLETQFGVDITVSESGEVGAYSISVYLGDVAIADGVNAEGLASVLQDRQFTAEELESLSIQVTGFEEPADGSSVTFTLSVTDYATGETVYATEDYVIAFGEQTIVWPNAFDENSRTSYTLSGISTDYASNMVLDIVQSSSTVSNYTLTVSAGDTVIAENASLADVQSALAERPLTPEEVNALQIDLNTTATSGSLTLTLSFKDAETDEAVGSAMDYSFTFTSGGGSSGILSGGSGSRPTTPDVDEDRDRVVESLKDYQNGITNDDSSKTIADDYTDHRVSNDMLKVILTNDGMVTFDPSVSQTQDSKSVDSAFNALKEELSDDIDGDSCFDELYDVYEDVIAYVLADDSVTFKTDEITTDNKEKYVRLFRAMVETVNGAAAAAITVYNENPDMDPTTKFETFKTEATNNATAALDEHLSDELFTSDEKLNIVNLASEYCQELFDANLGDQSLKDDLANAGTLTLSSFAEILIKYL